MLPKTTIESRSVFACLTALGLCSIACGANNEQKGYVLENSDTSNTQSATTMSSVTGSTVTGTTGAGTTGIQPTTTQGLAIGGTNTGGGGAAGTVSGTTGTACATESTTTELLPVFLVFGFDRSGSMGQGDFAWHDQTLKWDPVSQATQTFFADPASAGFSASLTFFPRAGEAETRCDAATYATPEVPMTPLPSPLFATALNQVPNETWIGGTPTLAIVEALITYTEAQATATPGRYAIVLVTDGYPQGCDGVTIQGVADLAQSVAAQYPTYVIGIANPPIDGAPETVADLNQIAVAGGTGQAFLIDTGNASATAAAFSAAIEQIRGSSISCDLNIPPPPDGSNFDKEKVAVNYTSGATGVVDQLVYDPDCTTQRGWHYDDPANPTLIQICDVPCAVIQGDRTASLSVDFVCERIIEIPE